MTRLNSLPRVVIYNKYMRKIAIGLCRPCDRITTLYEKTEPARVRVMDWLCKECFKKAIEKRKEYLKSKGLKTESDYKFTKRMIKK